MADIVFNVSKGRVNEFTRRVANNDPANSAFVAVLLKTVEADATLMDYATLGALLAAGGGRMSGNSSLRWWSSEG